MLTNSTKTEKKLKGTISGSHVRNNLDRAIEILVIVGNSSFIHFHCSLFMSGFVI